MKIKGKLVEPTVEPNLREDYKITNVEEIKTEKEGYEAFRVTFEPTHRATNDQSEYVTMLWKAETIPSNSKLGAFIDAFNAFLEDENVGYNTDNWIEHVVRFLRWKAKDREIEVIS